MRNIVTVRTEDGEEAAAIYSIRREKDKLVLDGKALGTMRMDMILSADEVIKAARMAFSWVVISFIALLPYFALKNRIQKRKK